MKRLALALLLTSALHAELTPDQQKVPLEALPSDPAAAKIVLLAGSPSNKPGQHEYFAGCALLRAWLSEVPGVAPVMVADGWPKNEAVLDGARCVLYYMDGGAKLPFLTPERLAKVKALADAGTGFVILHQAIDCPAGNAEDFKSWFGAVFQSDIGCRGHWDVKFESVTPHATTAGIKPFELVKDGWLYNLHFAEKNVTPVLACLMPEKSRTSADAKAHANRAEVVAWSYERANGGRSFGFTGCDLHASWAVPEQRRMLINALLWTAKLPATEPKMTPVDLSSNLDRKIFTPKVPKPAP